jgi:hypothetical protein
VTRRAPLAASVAALVAAVLIAVSGGFMASVGGVRVSARSWQLPAFAGAILVAAWLVAAVRTAMVRVDLAWLEESIEARGRAIAGLVSAAVFVAAVSHATFSASGSDASGYLSQAAMWSRVETRVRDPLVTMTDWPLPPSATAPLGWRPALDRGWQVPTYAPGLPLLAAVPHRLAGTAGVVWVVALSAGLAVWATSTLAWRLGGGTAAVLAALLPATSPTFLIHAFQPMSDVPVTAAWVLCWSFVLADAAPSAGVAAAMAVLIRPNLAPLAAVPWLIVTLRGQRGGRTRRAVRFALPVAAAGGIVAYLQWRWYGSPLTSGYGSARELFSIANVVPNAWLYASWLAQAEAAVLSASIAAVACWCVVRLVAPGARFLDRGGSGSAPGRPGARCLATAGLLTFAAGVIAAYLVYAVFEVWTYVRFLLPAIAVLAAVIGAALARGLQLMTPAARGVAVLLLAVAGAATGLGTARALGVFQVAAVGSRARDAGDLLGRTLTTPAVLLAGEQSGSMRYATGLPIVRWDTLDPASLRLTLSVLEARGYDTWWVLDQFEEPLVRARFAGVPEAALDSAPQIEAGLLMRTRAWRIRRRD